eukprot:jgi/Mesvir1/20939/Mv08010-RA.1
MNGDGGLASVPEGAVADNGRLDGNGSPAVGTPGSAKPPRHPFSETAASELHVADPYTYMHEHRRSSDADSESDISMDDQGLRSGREFQSKTGKYLVIKTLGRGTSGVAKLCLNLMDGNRPCVIKKVERRKFRRLPSRRKPESEAALDGPMREIAILKKLDHRNIIRLYHVIDSADMPDAVLMVLEYAEGGSLVNPKKPQQPMHEADARRIFHDICYGLYYLHHQRILHRDIKPENLLKTKDGTVKIADFGAAHICADDLVDGDLVSQTAGTPSFMAPEMLVPGTYHGRGADVWALGVTLYSLLFARLPFVGPSMHKLYENIREKPLEFPSGHAISKDVEQLLLGMLHKDPRKRLSLVEVMTDSWTTDNQNLRMTIYSKTTAPKPVEVSDKDVSNAISSMSLTEMFCDISLPQRTYKAGDVIFQQGEEATECFFINSGVVSVYIEDVFFSSTQKKEKSGQMELSRVSKGSFIGETAMILTQTYRSMSVCAVTDCQVLVLSERALRELLEREPDVKKRLQEQAHKKLLLRDKLRKKLIRRLQMELEFGLPEIPSTSKGSGMMMDSLALQSDIEEVSFKAGDTIARQGSEAMEAYFVFNGITDMIIENDRPSSFSVPKGMTLEHHLEQLGEPLTPRSKARATRSFEEAIAAEQGRGGRGGGWRGGGQVDEGRVFETIVERREVHSSRFMDDDDDFEDVDDEDWNDDDYGEGEDHTPVLRQNYGANDNNEGFFVGEIALVLGGRHHSETVKAVSDVRAIKIRKDDLMLLLESSPEIAAKLRSMAAAKHQETERTKLQRRRSRRISGATTPRSGRSTPRMFSPTGSDGPTSPFSPISNSPFAASPFSNSPFAPSRPQLSPDRTPGSSPYSGGGGGEYPAYRPNGGAFSPGSASAYGNGHGPFSPSAHPLSPHANALSPLSPLSPLRVKRKDLPTILIPAAGADGSGGDEAMTGAGGADGGSNRGAAGEGAARGEEVRAQGAGPEGSSGAASAAHGLSPEDANLLMTRKLLKQLKVAVP